MNGKLEDVTAWEHDSHSSDMLKGIKDLIYSPTRIKYPMVRRAWLERGPGADPGGRGTGSFIRVSWDKALDLVAGELQRVRDRYGPHGVFGGSYGWRSVGKLHNCRALLHRMLNQTGGFVNTIGDYSTGAAQVIMPHVVGALEVYKQGTSWKVIAEHTQLMVFWACDPANTNQVGMIIPDHGGFDGLEALKKADVKVICIDPLCTQTCRFLNGAWLAPRPQTDVAMMLGIAHTLYDEGLHDEAFLNRYTVGFDRFAPYLLGKTDGTAKTAQWASRICGIDAGTIRNLAHQFARHRTMIAAGWSIQRQHHGEQAHWMIVTLCAMLGQIGLPGGGFGFSYHCGNGGAPTATGPVLRGITAGPAVKGPAAGQPGAQTGAPASIPVSRLVEALLHPGKTIPYNGSRIRLPDIQMAMWAGGNPFSHQQDRNQMVRAWKKLATFVVQDCQWTASARHADIVLPVTTPYERNDIEQAGDYSRRYIVPMKKLIEPIYEAHNDFDILADICGRLGKRQEFTEGLEEMGWIHRLYEAARLESQTKDVKMPAFDSFWSCGEPLAFPVEDTQENFVHYAGFRQDPELNRLATPSGKIEIFSRTIEKMAYDDCPAHPTWLEPAERLGGKTAAYPLHIASNHPAHRLHSQLCSTRLREQYTIGGREPCWINPKDAGARGLQDGDIARVFNDRGQILVGIRVTDEIRPGVIRIDEGGWYDPLNPREDKTLCCYGDVNNLTAGLAASQLSQATCAHTALADIEKYKGEPPETHVFAEPFPVGEPDEKS